MPKLRYQPPERLPGATHFSAHEDLCGSENIVKLFKEDDAWEDLRDACCLEKNHGRKRMKGKWELAAVAFVVSGHVDLQPWYLGTPEELWRECGFAGKPSESTVDRRFHELEVVSDAFLDTASDFIQRCKEHDPGVMAHTHVDSTEDETRRLGSRLPTGRALQTDPHKD
jgi:hypothetical protein